MSNCSPSSMRPTKWTPAIEGALKAFPNRTMFACMADMELALRRAASAGLIDYKSGQSTFNLNENASLNEAQKKASTTWVNAFRTWGETGLAQSQDTVLFDRIAAHCGLSCSR